MCATGRGKLNAIAQGLAAIVATVATLVVASAAIAAILVNMVVVFAAVALTTRSDMDAKGTTRGCCQERLPGSPCELPGSCQAPPPNLPKSCQPTRPNRQDILTNSEV